MSYKLETEPSGDVTLTVEGLWDRETEAVWGRGGIDGLVLNYANGFEGGVEFLEGLKVKRLSLTARHIEDLRPLYNSADTLQALFLSTSSTAKLDLGQLPALRSLDVEHWKQIQMSSDASACVQDLYLGHYSERDLQPLAEWPALQRLRLKDRPALVSLSGVEALGDLRLLQVVGASRLEDFTPLDSLNRGLEELWLESCKKISSIDFVRRLESLTELTVADCGPIDSLRALRGLEHLLGVYMWESTQILDGDLSPLLELPSLRALRMRSRRHYRPSVADVMSQIGQEYP